MCVTPRDPCGAQLAARRPAASANSDCAFVWPCPEALERTFQFAAWADSREAEGADSDGHSFPFTTPPPFDAVVLYRSRENRLAALTAGPPISSNHRGEQPGTVREHVGIRSDWGQHGGLRLANSAKAIKLGEVVRHTEPDMAIATCFEPVNAPCVAQSLGARAMPSSRVLEGYTLSDLVKPRARLQAMLSIETVKPVRAHAGTRRRGREQGRRVH
jgi:Rrf2 family transcriptional regulator, nitric oxide-sensitive transcriptional repressor